MSAGCRRTCEITSTPIWTDTFTGFTFLICGLLQLESQLGGGYSNPLADPQFGSPSTHTLLSYFPEVELHIITLLEGERKVDQPIHQAQHFKELNPAVLEHAINRFAGLLHPLV